MAWVQSRDVKAQRDRIVHNFDLKEMEILETTKKISTF